MNELMRVDTVESRIDVWNSWTELERAYWMGKAGTETPFKAVKCWIENGRPSTIIEDMEK